MEQALENTAFLSGAMPFGLIAQQRQQIDDLRGVSELRVELARARIGGFPERNQCFAGEHHEQTDQAPLSGVVPAAWRARRRYPRLVRTLPVATIGDPEPLVRVGSHADIAYAQTLVV